MPPRYVWRMCVCVFLCAMSALGLLWSLRLRLSGWLVDWVESCVLLVDVVCVYALVYATKQITRFVVVDTHTHTHEMAAERIGLPNTHTGARFVFVWVGPRVWGVGAVEFMHGNVSNTRRVLFKAHPHT